MREESLLKRRKPNKNHTLNNSFGKPRSVDNFFDSQTPGSTAVNYLSNYDLTSPILSVLSGRNTVNLIRPIMGIDPSGEPVLASNERYEKRERLK